MMGDMFRTSHVRSRGGVERGRSVGSREKDEEGW